jgi:hypothetical protein
LFANATVERVEERVHPLGLCERARLSPRFSLRLMDRMRPPSTLGLNAPARFAAQNVYRRTSWWNCSISGSGRTIAIVKKRETKRFDE